MKNFIVLIGSAITVYAIMAFSAQLMYVEPLPEPLVVITPITAELNIPEVKVDLKGHDAFLDKLGNFESGNDYKKVNRLGYMGRYQFGRQALKQVDLDISRREFLNNPELQELAMERLMQHNNSTLERFIKKYNGKTLHGIKVTRSGVLAAAHLGGATNVKKWFRSGKDFKDANGTSITKYMKLFGGYSLSIE